MINTQQIRFVQIPAMTVASIQCITTSPEKDSLKAIIDFMEHKNLVGKKSAIRHFGCIPQFAKEGVADIDIFERLITVLEDMEIPEPFIKKTYSGGLYAAYTVPLGFFDKVSELKGTINSIPNYQLISSGKFDFLEEYLNEWLFLPDYVDAFFIQAQIDILLSVEII